MFNVLNFRNTFAFFMNIYKLYSGTEIAIYMSKYPYVS